ncbi:TPA: hypothetical protein ACNTUM_003225, partial [Escherichia coli]
KQGDSIFKSDYIITLVIFFRDHKLVIDNLFLGSNPQTLLFAHCLQIDNNQEFYLGSIYGVRDG